MIDFHTLVLIDRVLYRISAEAALFCGYCTHICLCVWEIIGKMISLSCQSKRPGRCLVDFCHRDSIGAVARVTVA